jgi:hypothetical protein
MNNPFPFSLYTNSTPIHKSIVVDSEPEEALDFGHVPSHIPIFKKIQFSEHPVHGFPEQLSNLILRNVPRHAVSFNAKPEDLPKTKIKPGLYTHPHTMRIWVVKMGMHRKPDAYFRSRGGDESHNMEQGASTRLEHVLDRMYRLLGVPVPRSQLYSEKTGTPVPLDHKWEKEDNPLRVSEFLGDDAYHLFDIARIIRGRDKDHQLFPLLNNPVDSFAEAKKETRKHAIIDAFLGARDVHDQNVMFTPHSPAAWRIDNGCGMHCNGFGRYRTPVRWAKMTVVQNVLPDIRKIWTEVYHPSPTQHSGVVYHGINGKEILDQSQDLVNKWKKMSDPIIHIVKTAPRGHDQIPVLENRIDILKQMLNMFNPEQLEKELHRPIEWDTGKPLKHR